MMKAFSIYPEEIAPSLSYFVVPFEDGALMCSCSTAYEKGSFMVSLTPKTFSREGLRYIDEF